MLPWNVVYILSSALGFVHVPDLSSAISFNKSRKKTHTCTQTCSHLCTHTHPPPIFHLFGIVCLVFELLSKTLTCLLARTSLCWCYFFSYTTDMAWYKVRIMLCFTENYLVHNWRKTVKVLLKFVILDLNATNTDMSSSTKFIHPFIK